MQQVARPGAKAVQVAKHDGGRGTDAHAMRRAHHLLGGGARLISASEDTTFIQHIQHNALERCCSQSVEQLLLGTVAAKYRWQGCRATSGMYKLPTGTSSHWDTDSLSGHSTCAQHVHSD